MGLLKQLNLNIKVNIYLFSDSMLPSLNYDSKDPKYNLLDEIFNILILKKQGMYLVGMV